MTQPPSTIAQALAQAAALGIARIDAHMLLLHALGQWERLGTARGRAWLMAHDDEPLSAAAYQYFEHAIAQRKNHVPVAYLIGKKDFYGLTLKIDPRVLDPRDDTETLVDWALEILKNNPQFQHVADFGTGSGAIILAIASQQIKNIQLHATDASTAALDVARENAQHLGLNAITFHTGAWFHALPPHIKLDLLVSNPPYIAHHDPHLPALVHEPLSALVAHENGLADLRHIIENAPQHLNAGAWVILEHGWDQAPAVADIFQRCGFHHIQTRHDLSGQPRCTGAQWG